MIVQMKKRYDTFQKSHVTFITSKVTIKSHRDRWNADKGAKDRRLSISPASWTRISYVEATTATKRESERNKTFPIGPL